MKEITIRFFKVLYVFLVIAAFIWALGTSSEDAPRSFTTKSTEIHCDNGKSFDPESKPIYPNGDEPDPPRYADIRHRQISSECEYGTAYFVGDGVEHPKNYKEEVKVITHTEGSWEKMFSRFAIIFTVFLLCLEVARRTLRYIFTGKSVFKLK